MTEHRLVDDLDRRIIACLEQNGRAANTQIAEALDVSESTVRKRLDRLLADDVIRISAVADPMKLNFAVVAVFLLKAQPNSVADVGATLAKLSYLRFIGLTAGHYDFVAEGWFTSTSDLKDFLTEKLLPVPGVIGVETVHVLDMIRYAYDWGINLDGMIDRRPGDASEDN